MTTIITDVIPVDTYTNEWFRLERSTSLTLGTGMPLARFTDALNVRLDIYGDVTTASSLLLFADGEAVTVNVGRYSEIRSSALEVVTSYVDAFHFVNRGMVVGDRFGVTTYGVASVIENSCTISAGYTGAVTVAFSGHYSTLINSGVLDSGDTTVNILADYVQLQNSGRIAGDLIGTSVAGTFAVVENDGVITGGNIGLRVSASSISIDNAGTIKGGTGIELSGGGFIANTGTIRGFDGTAISANGAVTLYNNGKIVGDVSTGAGADLYSAKNGGYIVGELDLGGGADEAYGRFRADIFNGGAGNDTLVGRVGWDTLNGGDDDDTLIGNQGRDTLDGGTGADTLNGGRDNDIMSGGAGDLEQDTFVFNVRYVGRDVITDFEDDIDKIDLSAYGIVSGDYDALLASAMTDYGDRVVIQMDAIAGQHGKIVLRDFGSDYGDALTASDFIW